MQSIVILSALTVASGIFGGGRTGCPNGQCPTPVMTTAPAPVAWGYSVPTTRYMPRYAPTVTYPAPRMVPPQMTYLPVPQYYPTTACASGTCPGR